MIIKVIHICIECVCVCVVNIYYVMSGITMLDESSNGNICITMDIKCSDETRMLTQQLLFSACRDNDVYLVQVLINRTHNINILNHDGWSLLGIACYHGNTDIVQLLIAHPNINVNGIGRMVENVVHMPLHLACETDQVAVVDILLQHQNIDINSISCALGLIKSNITVDNIYYSSYHNNNVNSDTNTVIVTTINSINSYIIVSLECTPFSHACTNKSMNTIFTLLDCPDLDIGCHKWVLPPLQSIVGYGFCEQEQHLSINIFDVYMDRDDVIPDLDNEHFLSSITNCIENSKYEITNHMIDKIVSINDNMSVDTLHILISALQYPINLSDNNDDDDHDEDITMNEQQHKQQSLIDKLLLIYTRQINKVNANGQTILHMCCYNSDHELIGKIVNLQHVDVNIQDDKGNTPLHYCVKIIDNICANIILSSQQTSVIDLDIKDNNDQTVIDIILNTLIHGLDFTDIGGERNKPILSMADSLFSHPNCNVTTIKHGSKNVFHIACYYHLNSTVKVLLSGINHSSNNNAINVEDWWGRTPLMEFCRGDSIINNKDINLDVLRLLLTTTGINLNAKDRYLQTVLSYATGNDNREILKYLLAASATCYDKYIERIIVTNAVIVTNDRIKNMDVNHHHDISDDNSDDDNSDNDDNQDDILTDIEVKSQGYYLIRYYKRNLSLLLKYQVEVDPISRLFTTIVLLCDNHLILKPVITTTTVTNNINNITRFYNIVCKLPMEIQMLLCHCMFGSSKQNVNSSLITEQAKVILNM